jgi:hypothetical protein
MALSFVNGAFRGGLINSPFMGNGSLPKPDTASSKPLFDWFDAEPGRRRRLVEAGYSDGRITNWKSRGVPLGEVGRVAAVMGINYERYMALASDSPLPENQIISPQGNDAEKLLFVIRTFLDTDSDGRLELFDAARVLRKKNASPAQSRRSSKRR